MSEGPDSTRGARPAAASQAVGGPRTVIPRGLTASLVLVRHGESTWVAERRFQGRGDPPLSSLGGAQADLVGRRLAHPAEPPALPLPGAPPLGIWHSPLRRAADTAAAIALARREPTGRGESQGPAGPPLHPSEAFTEIGQGAWEGLPAAEVEARWGRRLSAWRRDPTHNHAPGGESLIEADRRVSTGLEAILRALGSASEGQPHDGPARPTTFVPGYGVDREAQPWAIVVAHDGIFRLLLLRLLGLSRARFWSFPFPLAGISILELRDGLAVLRTHALVEHLAALTDDGQGSPREAMAEAERARSGAL